MRHQKLLSNFKDHYPLSEDDIKMSWWSIEPHNLFRRFFDNQSRIPRITSRDDWFGDYDIIDDMYRDFEDIGMEMEREFEDQLREIDFLDQKDSREYRISESTKVRAADRIVYSYSTTVFSDRRPRVKEFGSIKSASTNSNRDRRAYTKPFISSKTDPLVDITTTSKEIKVIAEIPGLNKQNTRINVYDDSLEILDDTSHEKYNRVIDLPPEVDIRTAKSKYNNGILEITFTKKILPRRKKIQVQ